MIDDNSFKTQDIFFKLVKYHCTRLILQVNIKNIYLSLKNNILISKKRRFSCPSHNKNDILDITEDNSLQTRSIRSKLVASDSIRLSIQVNIKNKYLLLKNILLFTKKRRFLCLLLAEHDILAMILENS